MSHASLISFWLGTHEPPWLTRTNVPLFKTEVEDLSPWLHGGDLAAVVACAGIMAIVAYSRWIARWWRARSGQPIEAATGPQRVASVTDGDSLRLVGIERAVRLIGADAPESTAIRFGEAECWGAQATARLEETLVDDRTVRIELGADPLDRYDRLLAYVWVWSGCRARIEQ